MNNLIIRCNKILKKYYPLKIYFDKISSLSHFWILSNNWNNFLPFNININGFILNGKYKDYRIITVITNKTLYWNKYILLYVSLLNQNYNPCINENKFMFLLHTYNYIKDLNIKKVIIKKNDNIIEYKINYIDNKNNINKINYNLTWNNYISNGVINKNNHFYLDSFDVYNNYKKLKIEIDRLIKNRDKYKTIHFHLDNNGGGDIVPAHLILRCLVGKKEKWMKNIRKIQSNKKIFEWDCWKEENKDSPNYEVVKKLNLDHLPNYDTKYNGKIFLHMYKQNGSAAWFFITYLIYSFSNKIERYSKKCYGQTIKYGKIQSDQLILLGHSGTTSGDGNSILVKYNNIEIQCPTQQFISCSIKKNDWNRFWIE
jgi:hypothetical protein